MMFSNFMDYPLFKRMFTKDQVSIMRIVISNKRKELMENNLTGRMVTPPVA